MTPDQLVFRMHAHRDALVLIVVLAAGCTSLLPMTHDGPKADEVHEVRVSCSRLMEICYPSVPLYLKLLGSVPLGCTQIWSQPWGINALIYSCWWTDPFTKAHEREHAEGARHAFW